MNAPNYMERYWTTEKQKALERLKKAETELAKIAKRRIEEEE
jgi:hypothetical protein